MTKNMKRFSIMVAISSTLIFTGCTPEEQALAAGATAGVIAGAAMASYNSPYYYDGRPYYYYGGYYRNGYYYYNGKRFYNGHYYNGNYRYYNGRRYTAQSGRYGYYGRRYR